MRTLFLLLFLVVSTTLYSQNLSYNSLSKNQKIYNLSLIWQEVNYNFAYFNTKITKTEWDSIYINAISQVNNTKSASDYYRVLQSVVGNLHEGHTILIPPKGVNDRLGIVSLIPRYINGNFYVVGVGVEYKDEVFLGDKIVEINNMDTKVYFDNEIYPFESCAMHSRYRFLDYKLLLGKQTDSLLITVKGIKDGKRRQIKLYRHSKYGQFHSYVSYHKIKNYSFSVINNNIAYINIGSFADRSILSKFQDDLDSIQKCSSVILDIRGNSGGSSFGDQICKYFTNDTLFESYSMDTRVNNAYYKALGAYSSSQVADILDISPRYNEYEDYFLNNKYENKKWMTSTKDDSLRGVLSDKKIVILTNQKVFSAAETFVLTFRNLNIGTVIGQPTAGSSTQPLIIPLLGGGHIRISTQRTLRKNGEIYSFIKPDILVNPLIEDYLNGYDRILNAAILFIEK